MALSKLALIDAELNLISPEIKFLKFLILHCTPFC